MSPDGKREKSVPGALAALKRVVPGCWSSSKRLRHPPYSCPPPSGWDPSGGRAGEQRGKSPAAAGPRHRPSSQPWALPLLPRDSASQSEAVADGPTDVLRFARCVVFISLYLVTRRFEAIDDLIVGVQPRPRVPKISSPPHAGATLGPYFFPP